MNKVNKLGLYLAIILMIAGCSPNTRTVKFYLLQAVKQSDQPTMLEERAKNLLVGVGPVDIPAYLDRPQIITGSTGSELQMAEYHRWAEPLRDTITRLLAENLASSMPNSHVLSFPWNRAINPDYQVEIKIRQFHVDVSGNCLLKADWAILKQNKPVLIKEFQTDVTVAGPNTDYEAKVTSLSLALARLGKEMGEELSRLYDPADTGINHMLKPNM